MSSQQQYCRGILTVLLLILLIFGWVTTLWIGQLKEPQADVKEVRLTNIIFKPLSATVSVQVLVHITNPNGVTFTPTLEEASVHVFSMDSQNLSDAPFHLGRASISSQGKHLSLTPTLELESLVSAQKHAHIVSRLRRDCGVAGVGQTLFLVRVDVVKLKIHMSLEKLRGPEIAGLIVNVTCPGLPSSAPTTTVDLVSSSGIRDLADSV
eukprot:TRINITY_DN56725_c0_g1_i1.p1 TRINITY_DN56725_c0_g1~~TRINITY_DN56725_c0_g1_i1.p1  ORF type:complete len:209 (+),score=20.65 TRINITY_DN56725_c0_g1_i1:97-723(+)